MLDYPTIADTLAREGWLQLPEFLDQSSTAALAQLLHTQTLQPARIGHHAQTQRADSIRGDSILWLEGNEHPALSQLFQRLEELKLALNRELMLGLFTFEAHFARYPTGTFYKKHLDQFRDDDTRRLSCVLYLNTPDWSPTDGGALRLHLDPQHHIDLPPTGGTLVLFLSAQLWHEVLPTHRERLSLTVWFRVRQ